MKILVSFASTVYVQTQAQHPRLLVTLTNHFPNRRLVSVTLRTTL